MKPVGIDTGGTNIRILTSECGMKEQKSKTPETKAEYLEILNGYGNLLADSFLVDAVAGPISPNGSQVEITNRDWGVLTTDEIMEASRAGKVILVNDLKAVGRGVAEVRKYEHERIETVSGEKQADVYETVMAPGTGIGVAKLTPDGSVLAGEGGWVLAQPTDEIEQNIIAKLRIKLERDVACEDLAANPALYNIWCNNPVSELEEASDKPLKISQLANEGNSYCISIMKRAARFLGQCAQANMLSPPICDALCLVGHYGDNRDVDGYTERLLEALYNSRHGERLKNAHVYTIKDADNLGAVGSLAFAKEMC